MRGHLACIFLRDFLEMISRGRLPKGGAYGAISFELAGWGNIQRHSGLGVQPS